MATKNSINSNIPIEVTLGGTGAATLGSNGVLLGNGTSAVSATAAGTDGQILIGATGLPPAMASLTAGANITLTPGANTLSIAANAGAITYTYTAIDDTDSPYTVLVSDSVIGCDSAAGAITVNLPDAPATGASWIIKDVTGSANAFNITLTTPGGVVLIDIAATYVMNTNYQSVQVVFNGSKYIVV
jgi:hypothetical protein